MKAWNVAGGIALSIGAVLAGLESLTQVLAMIASAVDYGAHHEVTVPLCRFLALVLVSLGMALAAGRALEGGSYEYVAAPLKHFGATALIAWAGSFVFANETFFSLYDPKGFPVHLTEPVLFPEAGWHGMTSHLLAAVCLAFAFTLLWITLREEKTRPDGDTNR
ncbi:MAG: hypothetical protein P9L99_15175 [Candidatus Lernaella stagnicola]|nr:hypothetical protein [Candidatus Lernaella stagnicola]